jgi:hypothetical protein
VESNVSSQKTPKNGTAEKSLRVDRAQFEGIVKQLIHSAPVKRDDVKVSKKKPAKLIPPQK